LIKIEFDVEKSGSMLRNRLLFLLLFRVLNFEEGCFGNRCGLFEKNTKQLNMSTDVNVMKLLATKCLYDVVERRLKIIRTIFFWALKMAFVFELSWPQIATP
jgi:hypothetical protein